MTPKSILIIGEDPKSIDFDASDAPKDMTAEKVMEGLNGSVARLAQDGHVAELLLTTDAGDVEDQVETALSARRFDIIVIGAGLRTLPPMAERFERIMNVLHIRAPGAKLAFNSRPDDSDVAARRWIDA